jgi:hypothetical protein
MATRFHPVILERLRSLQQTIERTRALNSIAHALTKALAIPTTDSNRRLTLSYDGTISLWITYPHVGADARDLRKLIPLGLHQRSHKPSWFDKSSGTTYYFLFLDKDPDHAPSVTLYAQLPIDGTGTCRRVKVGERTETFPIYEVQCPDQEAAA